MQGKTKHGQYCRAVSNLNDFEAGLTEKEVELCPIFFFDPKHLRNNHPSKCTSMTGCSEGLLGKARK